MSTRQNDADGCVLLNAYAGVLPCVAYDIPNPLLQAFKHSCTHIYTNACFADTKNSHCQRLAEMQPLDHALGQTSNTCHRPRIPSTTLKMKAHKQAKLYRRCRGRKTMHNKRIYAAFILKQNRRYCRTPHHLKNLLISPKLASYLVCGVLYSTPTATIEAS